METFHSWSIAHVLKFNITIVPRIYKFVPLGGHVRREYFVSKYSRVRSAPATHGLMVECAGRRYSRIRLTYNTKYQVIKNMLLQVELEVGVGVHHF